MQAICVVQNVCSRFSERVYWSGLETVYLQAADLSFISLGFYRYNIIIYVYFVTRIAKMYLRTYADSLATDQPVDLRSLI